MIPAASATRVFIDYSSRRVRSVRVCPSRGEFLGIVLGQLDWAVERSLIDRRPSAFEADLGADGQRVPHWAEANRAPRFGQHFALSGFEWHWRPCMAPPSSREPTDCTVAPLRSRVYCYSACSATPVPLALVQETFRRG